MVARSPPKLRKMATNPPNSTQLRETLEKVDKCMARLQELQYAVAGGKKVISGVNLSPRSTRGYLKTSLRCKQESLRIKNGNPKKSPNGKFPNNSGDWRRMSLPAMLVEETVGEILQASNFAREIVSAVNSTTNKIHSSGDGDGNDGDNPKTPPSRRQSPVKKNPEKTQLRTRRKREKQIALQSIRSDNAGAPTTLQRAKSRINFKSSPLPEKENISYWANRVSPRNRPWEKKTVLFPNPIFQSSSPTSQKTKISKSYSPIIGKNRQPPTITTTTPHKFLIKKTTKIRSPPLSRSPTKPSSSQKVSSAAITAMAKIRRSISPSRLANRLVSPLKSRRSYDGLMMTNVLKKQQQQQQPPLTAAPMRLFSVRRV